MHQPLTMPNQRNCVCEVVDTQWLQISHKCEGHSTVFHVTCAHFDIIWHQDLFICDTSTKWIVSHINKPYIYVGNRVRLDYFLNILSSRLDWMHPQHPWLEKYLTVNITQQRNPQMKFQVWNPQTRSRLKISFRNDQSCLP